MLLFSELGWWSWWWAEYGKSILCMCSLNVFRVAYEVLKGARIGQSINWFQRGKIRLFSTVFQCGFAWSNDVGTSPNLTHKYFKMFLTTFMFWPKSKSHIKMLVFKVEFSRAETTTRYTTVYPARVPGTRPCTQLVHLCNCFQNSVNFLTPWYTTRYTTVYPTRALCATVFKTP